MTAAATAVEPVLKDLAALLGDRLSTAQAVREQHGKDEAWIAPMPPDAVVFPESTEEVAAVVRLCAAHGIPVIPYGTGTSLEGHVHAVRGGVSIDVGSQHPSRDCALDQGVARERG